MVLTMDGYGAHTTYKALKYLRDNNTHVIALLARRKPQDSNGVLFGHLTYLWNALNERSLVNAAEERKLKFTLCELSHAAYRRSVTYRNILNGFRGCSLWCAMGKTSVPDVIRLGDVMNRQGYDSREAAFAAFKDFVTSYASTRNLIRSDGHILDSGTRNTRAGALLTTDDALETERKREVARALVQEQRNAHQVDAASRLAGRGQEAPDRVRLRTDAQGALHNHTTWLAQRDL